MMTSFHATQLKCRVALFIQSDHTTKQENITDKTDLIMVKGQDKVVKTYGRHKNRVIKTDLWDSEFNRSVTSIFSVSDSIFDSSADFEEPKKSKPVSKKKQVKDEDKENQTTKQNKPKRRKKKKDDHKLFSEKETTSSFSDCPVERPLKDLPPKVPASVRKNRAGNRTKLRFEESQLQIESKEKSMSMNFSDFDSYNLCISDSPIQTAPKPECPTSTDSDRLGKVISPEIFSKLTKCSQSSEPYKNFENPNQKNPIKRKPKKKITTSTPLATITAVSRLQNPESRIYDDHSLFGETHTDYYQDSLCSINNLKDQDDSVRYITPKAMTSRSHKESLPPKENTSTGSAGKRPFDCYVSVRKIDQDYSLNLSDQSKGSKGDKTKDSLSPKENTSTGSAGKSPFDCYVSLRKIDQDYSLNLSDQSKGSKGHKTKDSLSPTKTNSGSVDQSLHECFIQSEKLDQETGSDRRPAASENNNNIIYNNNFDGRASTKNQDSNGCMGSPKRSCANCSFGHPCGDACVYLDNKPSPDNCSVEFEALEDLFFNIPDSVIPEDSDADPMNFDASKNLFESYSSRMLQDSTYFEGSHMGGISDIAEEEEKSVVEKMNHMMGSTVLSDVEVEDEPEIEEDELVDSSSGADESDVEDESGDVHRNVENCTPVQRRYSKRMLEKTYFMELSYSSSEADENCVPVKRGNFEQTVDEIEEGELVDSSSEDDESDKENESRDIGHVENCSPAKHKNVKRLKSDVQRSSVDEIEEGELVDSSSEDDESDKENESRDIGHVENCSPAKHKNVKRLKSDVQSLPIRSPYRTRNYTSSICTDTDSICTNVTQNSLLIVSFVPSPYMTRHCKLVVDSSNESMGYSLPSTPTHNGSGRRSYEQHVGNVSHKSDFSSDFSSPSMRSFVEILSPKVSHKSPRMEVLEQCEQDDFISFTDCINSSMMKNCVKIGEGVYGEVFRTKKKGQSVALKIIPIEGDFEVNDCPQKEFVEMLPEIVISRELSNLRDGIENQTQNFVLVNSVSCLKGAWPAQLMKEWDIFHKQKRSENDRPDCFDNNQLFIMFEFGDGGSALETFKFTNLNQTKSVLQQVAYGLAIAESAFEFEHRDLHWGNVLVRPCPKEQLHYRLDGSDIYLPSWGLEVSIIDFTLSRLQKDGCTVFCDLAKDDSLFDGTGDYQFDVYRSMRIETENKWENYCPKTNVYWIHYLADKLLKNKKHEKSTRGDQEILRSLRQFVREVTDYASAVDLVTTCPFMMASE